MERGHVSQFGEVSIWYVGGVTYVSDAEEVSSLPVRDWQQLSTELGFLVIRSLGGGRRELFLCLAPRVISALDVLLGFCPWGSYGIL